MSGGSLTLLHWVDVQQSIAVYQQERQRRRLQTSKQMYTPHLSGRDTHVAVLYWMGQNFILNQWDTSAENTVSLTGL